MEKRYLSAKKTAEFLGMPLSTLYGYTYKKAIPYIKLGKGNSASIKFDRTALEKWMKDKEMRVIRIAP